MSKMKSLLIPFILIALASLGIGQRTTRTETVPGSIVVLSCYQCPTSIERLPEIAYPGYVGYGPHLYTGINGVVIEIEKDGTVSAAKAISGHPYFRKMLEEHSKAAKFSEIDQKTKAVLQFRISSPKEISADSQDTTDLSSRSQIAEPIFTEELREACATGSVTVDVAAKNGSVEMASPISGDPILFPYALSAAFRSKLPSDRSAGRLTIKFPNTDKCVFAGELNKKIVSMPRIPIHGHARVDCGYPDSCARSDRSGRKSNIHKNDKRAPADKGANGACDEVSEIPADNVQRGARFSPFRGCRHLPDHERSPCELLNLTLGSSAVISNVSAYTK